MGVAWLVRRKFYVLTKDLRPPLPQPHLHHTIRWTLLSPNDIPQILALNPTLAETEIRRRLLENQECHLGWAGKDLVHYRWEACKPTYLPYLGKTIRPYDGDIIITEAFTSRAFRKRGFYTASTHLALHRAKEMGFRRIVGLAACWNAPALHVMQKAGRAITGSVGYWTIPGRRFYFATGSVRFDNDGNLVLLP